MNINDLTPEQKEQARACKTPEEMMALAKKLGYKLSDEELDSIAGGGSWSCWCDSECSSHGGSGLRTYP